MGLNDLHADIEIYQLRAIADTTADAWCAYLDLASVGAQAVEIIVAYGVLTGAVDDTNYFTPTLKEATATPASTASYSSVAAADIRGGVFTAVDTLALDSTYQRRGYIGNSRYLTVLLDETGTISASQWWVAALVHRGRHRPASSLTEVTGAIS